MANNKRVANDATYPSQHAKSVKTNGDGVDAYCHKPLSTEELEAGRLYQKGKPWTHVTIVIHDCFWKHLEIERRVEYVP